MGPLKRPESLIVQLRDDGAARVWVPQTRRFFQLDPRALQLLHSFRSPSVPSEAAEAAGMTFDDATKELVTDFVAHGLLIEAPESTERVRPRRAIGQPPLSEARKLVECLADEESFQEDRAAVDGLCTGVCQVDGRPICVAAIASDFGRWFYNLDHRFQFDKLFAIQDKALRLQVPLVYVLYPSAADADPQTAMQSMTDLSVPLELEDETNFLSGTGGFGGIHHNVVRLSGEVPQVALVLGPVRGPMAFLVPLCDSVAMLEPGGFVAIGDPWLVRTYMGQTVSAEELGGARMHCTLTGLGDVSAASPMQAVEWVRRLLRYLPSSRTLVPPPIPAVPSSVQNPGEDGGIPTDPASPLNMKDVIATIVDGDSLLEVKALYAPELIAGFACIDGLSVGVVGNNSTPAAGALTIAGCKKLARFVSLCNAYNIPLVFLVDTPGFIIGKEAEQQGILNAAGRAMAAVSGADVPKVTVVVRKAFTAALWAMAGPAFRPAAFLALPSASITIHRSRLLRKVPEAEAVQMVEAAGDASDREVFQRFLESRQLHAETEAVVDSFLDLADVRGAVARRLRELPESFRLPRAGSRKPPLPL